MDDEKWTRLSMSDKIRRFETQKPPQKPQVNEPVQAYVYGVWSFSEALEIGASLAEESATSQVVQTHFSLSDSFLT
jgi:hypothetical protein